MAVRSAGILLYRMRNGLEVFLAHPGGPYFVRKDLGVWTVPKGLIERGEDDEAAARREFAEETGFSPEGELADLGEVKFKSRKVLRCFALRFEADPPPLSSNTFKAEFPPRSGKFRSFPELDDARFFTLGEAREKIHPVQRALLDRLEKLLDQHSR